MSFADWLDTIAKSMEGPSVKDQLFLMGFDPSKTVYISCDVPSSDSHRSEEKSLDDEEHDVIKMVSDDFSNKAKKADKALSKILWRFREEVKKASLMQLTGESSKTSSQQQPLVEGKAVSHDDWNVSTPTLAAPVAGGEGSRREAASMRLVNLHADPELSTFAGRWHTMVLWNEHTGEGQFETEEAAVKHIKGETPYYRSVLPVKVHVLKEQKRHSEDSLYERVKSVFDRIVR